MQDRILSDRYRVISHLARGGMADVYEAEDTLLSRRVAVKVLHTNFASDQAFVTRFKREAQAAANLSHPNIVAIYDWGQEGTTYYMVMELIEGRTLREILKAEGALLPRRAAEIAAETAAALTVAHQAGVVHRDIKPGNIMITNDGAVKVTDFGIARALDDSEELTRTGAVIGTATYFSPEQAQGLPADGRSDVYSLGVVLYEMLTAQPPFTGESPVAVAYQHVSEYAVPVDQINPDVPGDLALIVERAMEKDPAARYQTAAEFREDLLRFLRGEPTAAAATAAAAAATQVMMTPPPPATVPPDETARHVAAAPADDRSSTRTYLLTIFALLAVLAAGIFLLSRLLNPVEPVAAATTVPELTGVERSDAFEQLQARDLKVRQREEPSSLIEANHVIVTDPPGGTVVEPGSFVLVILSTGEEVFTIPNVVDDTLETATARLETNGFVVGTVSSVFSDTVPAGIVIRQSPRGGSPADPGTAVDLDVSDGPFAIEMPDVIGLSEQDAIRTLQEDGFEDIVTVEEFDDEVLEGLVISTDPEPGEAVPREGRVTLAVSKGPEPFELPDLIGKTVDEARTIVSDLGLVFVQLETTTPVTADSGLDGLVATQSPPEGSTVNIGEEVAVSVGELIQVEVPDLIGLSEDDAADALEELGLTLEVVGNTEVDPEGDLIGMIATQEPSAGETVPDGSAVEVTIGVAPAEPPPADDGGGDDG